MGMFDRVIASCPECGRDVEFQSKAGPCRLHVYRADRGVPPAIADALQGVKEYCFCGTGVELEIPAYVPRFVPMVAVKVD